MLNITENKIHCESELAGLQSLERTRLAPIHLTFRRMMLILLGIFVVFLFLPWTQNVRADGKVTTLRPEQRPQTIPAVIAGRIEHWYVVEGQAVKKGDTIVHISEIKSEYFDPQLVERVGAQVAAKEGSIEAYEGKAEALETQIAAMRRELDNKMGQIRNKIEQAKLKVTSDSVMILQARTAIQIAQRQYDGVKNLYEKNLKSLTEFEEKRDKLFEAQTKLTDAQNKYEISRRELENYRIEYVASQNEYANKIAKTQSERYGTLSDGFDAQASVNKLRVEKENYARRAAFYYIVAPQDGYVVKAVKPGIGETVKEGDPIVTIQPADYQLAVEMYVRPMDLPLLATNRQVRFLFDGWPAFFFSGWPNLSLGAFGGRIAAIDRNISSNGKFRVLVAPDPGDAAWPDALQPGGGAKGIALLNDVPLWYELWRVLNGFPPDQYQPEGEAKEKASESLTPKAPVKNAK